MPDEVQAVRHVADAADPAEHDAGASVELVSELFRLGDLVTDGVVVDDRAEATERGLGRLDEIADGRRIEGDVQTLPERVDASRRTEHRVDAAFPPSNGRLVIPVELTAFARDRLVLAHVADVAPDAAHGGVGVVGDHRTNRRRVVHRRGVREHQDLATGDGRGLVLARRLALPGQIEQLHAIAVLLPNDRVRAIGRAVRRNQDLELVGGIVEAQRVVELLGDHVLLVVGGDDHRHGRRRRCPQDRPRPDARDTRNNTSG